MCHITYTFFCKNTDFRDFLKITSGPFATTLVSFTLTLEIA